MTLLSFRKSGAELGTAQPQLVSHDNHLSINISSKASSFPVPASFARHNPHRRLSKERQTENCFGKTVSSSESDSLSIILFSSSKFFLPGSVDIYTSGTCHFNNYSFHTILIRAILSYTYYAL